MNQHQLLIALSSLTPGGCYEGIDAKFPTPNSYAEYVESLRDGFEPYSEAQLQEAWQAWLDAAPLREAARLTVTPPQFRKMLRTRSINGKSLAYLVDELVTAMPQEERDDYHDWLDYLPATIRRNSPRVEAVRVALGISVEDANEWFRVAAMWE